MKNIIKLQTILLKTKGEESMVIPYVRETTITKDKFLINPLSKIILCPSCNNEDMYGAKLLQLEIKRLIGFNIDIIKGNVDYNSSIRIRRNDLDLDIREDLKGDVEKVKRESYELNIFSNNIEIRASEASGIFYGIQSLRQILREEGLELQGRSIIDYPHFSERGFYHDVTRGKIPTLQTLKELVDRMAFYKLNQLQLYIEHTFAFKDHTELWAGNDPLTAEEILELDDYCRKNHVELVPSLASFGHLYHALKSYSFNDICEIESSLDSEFSWIDRMNHHTVDISNPKSLDFIKEMLEEFIPLFTSNKFNICCDETFDLGKGKSKKLADELGNGKIYVDFLNKIIDIVKENNKIAMFWGDIIIKYPELLEEIPKDVICLNWNYSPMATENSTKLISESGLPVYVCPGVSGWDNFMNNISGSYENISKMVSYGMKYGVMGVLNTDWGDYGHINLLASSMVGMIYGAALSWSGKIEENSEKLDESISILEFGDKSKRIVSTLKDIYRAQAISHLEIVWWRENRESLVDIFERRPELRGKYLLNISEEKLHEGINLSYSLEKTLLNIMGSVSESNKQDYKEFYISNMIIRLMNSLYLVIKKYDLNEEVKKLECSPNELAKDIEIGFHIYSNVWRERNKESELFRIKHHFEYICKWLRMLEEK